MAKHVAALSDKVNSKVIKKESLRLNYQSPPEMEEECIYDLKAVCNHVGLRINSGHYTATCYNEANGAWYLYDDKCVHQVIEENIVTPSAYLLFYQRRKLSTRVADNVHISKVKTHHMQHWSYEIPQTARTNSNGLHFVMKEDNETN